MTAAKNDSNVRLSEVETDFNPSASLIDVKSMNDPLRSVTDEEVKRFVDHFRAPLTTIFSFYKPIFQKQGRSFSIELLHNVTSIPVYSALVTNINPNVVIPMIEFGFAMQPEFGNGDGLILSLCHEIGHALGGYPLVPQSNEVVYASGEGQSDYYASLACARKVWTDDLDLNQKVRRDAETSEPKAVTICTDAWTSPADQNLCVRSLLAGKAVMNILAKKSGDQEPSFDSSNSEEVNTTRTGYPSIQCRLDTIVQGAICQRPYDFTKVAKEKADIASNSCVQGRDRIGARPRCWFKPD